MPKLNLSLVSFSKYFNVLKLFVTFYLSCLHSEAFLPKHCADLCSLRGESYFVPWLSGDAEIIAFRGINMRWQQTLQQIQVFRFFMVPVKKAKPLSEKNLQKEPAG